MGKKSVRKKRGGELRPEIAASYGISVKQPTADETLSPNEIGKILNVTGEAVKQWIYHRRLPAVKLRNGYWKVRKSDLEAFLQERVTGGQMKVLLAAAGNELLAVVEAVIAAGHRALTVNSLTDAMIKLMDVRPNLVMIELSWKDCWKFAEAVRGKKSTKHLAMLFLSTKPCDDSDMARMTKLDAQGCIQLPANKQLLADEINKSLFRTG